MGRDIAFGILGPLEVHAGDQAIRLPPKLRGLLAAFLCRPNAPIPGDRLIEALWRHTPPRSAAKGLHVYIHRLRQALDDEGRIQHSGSGHALVVKPGELDADRFEELVEQGRTTITQGRLARGAELLREALSMWRGEVLLGQDTAAFVAQEKARLEQLRQIVLEQRIQAELALGRHAEVLAELHALVAEHPLREGLRGQLMLALYRVGRTAEALAVYREGRGLLVEELGLEPGPALRRLEHAILTNAHDLDRPDGPEAQDGGLLSGEPAAQPRAAPSAAGQDSRAAPKASAAMLSPQGATPCQLPPDVAGFTGRQRELEQLDTLVEAAGGAGPVLITAIDGMPGVGKPIPRQRYMSVPGF